MEELARVVQVVDFQQKLAAHFCDTTFPPKQFDLLESTGRYVHRQDKDAMTMFLQEVECLCRCRRIINIGGFLNEASVRDKVIEGPYAAELI
jgi:SUMO ligase MMS21 Smc5/6 complex component